MASISKIGTMEFKVINLGQEIVFTPHNKDAEIHMLSGYKNGVYKIDSLCRPYMTTKDYNYLSYNYMREKNI